METKSFVEIMGIVVSFHIAFISLFLSMALFCSNNQNEQTKNIFFSSSVIREMAKKGITVEKVHATLDNGHCYHACLGGLLYVGEISKLGVIIDKKKTKIINIISNQDELWLEKFLAMKDITDKNNRIRKKKSNL